MVPFFDSVGGRPGAGEGSWRYYWIQVGHALDWVLQSCSDFQTKGVGGGKDEY